MEYICVGFVFCLVFGVNRYLNRQIQEKIEKLQSIASELQIMTINVNRNIRALDEAIDACQGKWREHDEAEIAKICCHPDAR